MSYTLQNFLEDNTDQKQKTDFYENILDRVINLTTPLIQIRSYLADSAEQTESFLSNFDVETRDSLVLLESFQAQLIITKEETVRENQQVGTLKVNAKIQLLKRLRT